MTRILIFFLFLDESICCWYSLEASQQGTLMSYATCFHGEISSLSRAMEKADKQSVEAAGRSTAITLSIGTPYLLTILLLKFEIVHFTTSRCV